MFEIENLDIVITRNCQLACRGCLVFSDHAQVKGHLNPHDWVSEISWWASKLKPKTIHLFGGEPLMNPWIEDWIRLVALKFKRSINIQTNGILIPKLAHGVLKNLINRKVRISISKHSNDPEYLAKIEESISILRSAIDYRDENKISDTETVYHGTSSFSVVDWTRRPWVAHYDGWGDKIKPGNAWDSDKFTKSHYNCEAKTYIQLYKGSLWKCPTMAVLGESLEQIGANLENWKPWLDYKPLTIDSDDDTIQSWLEAQRKPERVCNMCFGEPRPIEQHFTKIKEIKNV